MDQVVPAAAAGLHPQLILGAASLLVTGLLFLLYFYRPRLYIRYWILGWTIAAASPLLLVHRYDLDAVNAAFYGLSQFLAIVSALVFVISADAYRTRPRLRRGYAIGLLPVLLWFSLAPIQLGPLAVHGPGHLLIAGGFAAAGVAHLLLMRQTRLLGAALVGGLMLLVAAANGWWALDIDATVGLSNRAVFLKLALNLAIALAMQLMTFEDLTFELRQANRRLEATQGDLRDLVTRDELTGCRNRRFFDEVIGHEIRRRERYGIPLSVLFIDINRFKVINDTLGHEVGDQVLVRVAGFLVRHVRDADYVFRWGGDEFLVLMSCRLNEAERKAADLKSAFFRTHAATLPAGVGLSIGCAEADPDAEDVMEIVKQADERMYEDKRRGEEARVPAL